MAVIHNQQQIWTAVLESLKLNVSDGIFNSFLRRTSLVDIHEVGDRAVYEVACDNVMVRNQIENRHLGQLLSELQRITDRPCEIKLVIQTQGHKGAETQSDLPLFAEKRIDTEDLRKTGLRPSLTFANYAVSGSNQMAYAAAMAVAQKPGEAYNPLFIYGGVGVGKTHLMQAIGHGLLEKGETRVLFCTGDEFTNDLVEGIRSKTTDKVRAKYRKVKLLMIDDVQFIAGKISVQEDFFHTFNDIQRAGGQIVMTSDKPPAEINKLEPRLRSRFGAGLIVDVGPADFELRTAILLIKAKQRQIELDIELAKMIAEKIEGLRELEGILGKLALQGLPVTPEKIAKVLQLPAENKDGGTRLIGPNDIFNLVSHYYSVGIPQLKGGKRNKHIVWPRQILMYLLKNDLGMTYQEVGHLVGNRDHTTVIHAEEKIKALLIKDQVINNQLVDIRKKMLITS